VPTQDHVQKQDIGLAENGNMIKLLDILKELEISPTGQLQQNSEVSSILKQLIVQDLGHLIGYDEDENEDEWISEWNWDNKPYKVLTNDVEYIVFLDNNPKILHELYKDAIDWHPKHEDFQDNFVESYFIRGVQDAYKGNMNNINTMMNAGYTGTTDNLEMVKINGKNQLLYFFNI
jgi:hypothetical protein